jgi:aspartate-semialdehyde dehydrogenase
MGEIAVVGVTGAVGTELLRVMERRNFPVDRLHPLASPRSAGQTITFRGKEVVVKAADTDSFTNVSLAFFSAGATRSRALIPAAQAAGALVVDNSSAFRMDPQVPLIVPEVNGNTLNSNATLVANPNCVAAILTMILGPLAQRRDLRRIVVSTYQSASGAGARAMEDLLEQTRNSLAGRPVVPKILKHPYAFNLFSHDSDVEANHYNGEENKVIAETNS